jgi:predicted transcriptional regulator
MASEDRRFIIDHEYKLQTGKYLKRSEIVELIKQSIKNGNFTTSLISRHVKLDMKQLGNIIRHMIDKDLIIANRGNTKGGGYIYSLKDECLLADMFYPKPQDVEKSFTIKSKMIRKSEQGTSKSLGGSKMIKYSNGYYDSVYWG